MSHLFFRSIPPVLLFLSHATGGYAQSKATIDIRVDTRRSFQTIDNFGASDAWSCRFAGLWPDSARNQMADWLFSMDTLPNGNPRGIGLSLWRINIGAGSAEQGSASRIRDEWRRAGGWSQQKGQQWFAEAARQRGVRQFLGFFNSPPVQLTRNGRAWADSGHCNIAPDKYAAFAGYAADMIRQVRQTTGITLDYLSPVNEPQWDWSDGGQEGCPYTNREIYGVVKAFDSAFHQNRLTTKLLLAEAGEHTYLLEDGNKPGRGNQLTDFFSAASSDYIGHLHGVAPKIASHSYFTSSPFAKAIAVRKKIAEKVAALPGLAYWQSEYCILGDNGGEINGSRRDTGMQAALYLAGVVYADLVAGNAAAWHWWLAISPYDYKDGLIYIDKNAGGGRYRYSKMLWALGNYSRFVRPGMKRVYAEGPAAGPLLVSAWKDEQQKQLVMVVVNRGDETLTLTPLGANGTPLTAKGRWSTYTTSMAGNLEKHTLPAGPVAIAPRSVVTIEMTYD